MSHSDLHKYDDIIHLSHHVSKKHRPMKISDRAAQFGSFAALTGHSDAISETARLTSQRPELSEHVLEILDAKLQIIRENLDNRPEITVTYFKPDELKEGGAYITFSGKIVKIDEYKKLLTFEEKKEIPIEMIHDIESDIFTFDIAFL